MKMTTIFKKSAVFATAMLLVLLMAISVMPLVQAADSQETDPPYRITKGTVDLKDKLTAMNISQSGNITMMFYYTNLDAEGGVDDDDYLEVTVPQQNGPEKVTRYYKKDLTKTDNRWLVEVPVAAAQQTDLVKLQWFKVENGSTIGATIREYSVKYYADVILGNPESKMIPAVKSMLNYGAMAQTMFGYKTGNLANKDLYTKENNPVNGMISEHFYDYDADDKQIGNGDVATFEGADVLLQDRITMRFYFKYADGYSSENTTVAISKDGVEVGDGYNVHFDKELGFYYVNIHNVSAHNFDVNYTVAVRSSNDGASEASLTHSVLGYAADTLTNYLSTDAQKDTAKALYLYYAWMRNYATVKDEAQEDYVPGPKDAVCSHERSHLEGELLVCSDCGNTVTATKLYLERVDTNEVSVGAAATATFDIKIYGVFNLSSLVVIPQFGGNDVTFTVTGASSAIRYTKDVNLVIEPADNTDAITSGVLEDGYLATIECALAPEADGEQKLALAVIQATQGVTTDVTDSIISSPAVIDVEKAICPDSKHTAIKYKINDDKHIVHCSACERVIGDEAHNAAEDLTWSHVIEAEGGKVTGELFEEKKCVCGYVVETRELYYKNNIDSVMVNDTVINPYAGNKGQTAGIIFHDDSGYATLVLSPENFIWSEIVDGKVVEGTTIPLTFKDTDSFKTGGWFAVNGGVERYVIKIDTESSEGTWETLAGTPGSTNPEATAGIGGAINGNANITDKVDAHTNSSYQDGLAYHDFEAYANQTITVTLGAVPKGNPGTKENPNVLITAVVENLKVECTHRSENLTSVEATDDPTVFNATCACGETLSTSDVNEEGLKMFAPDEMFIRTTGHNASYTTSKLTENGLDFVRFELTSEKANGTELLWYFLDGASTTAPQITYGVSNTFMIVYRANEKYNGTLTMFAKQTEYKSQGYSVKDDNQWHVAMYDLSSLIDASLEYIAAMRLDIFDAVAIEKGAIIDIAYMGFFKSEDHALENYARAAAKHEAIGKAANWAINLDNFIVDNVSYKEKNPPLTTSNGQFGCHQVDLNGYTIATADKSIIFNGWLVTPFGAEGIYYTITDAEDNVSERRFYLKPGVISAGNGIVGATTSYRYGSGRLNGSAFQASNKYFDLSGYEGETVSIDVILVNNIGQEGTIMQIKNVAVPDHKFNTVNAKAPTCTTTGNEAYQTCDTCSKVFDLEGNVLDAIPTIDIVPTAHNVVDKAYIAPTTAEDGQYAHKACTICGKAWNAEGEEIAVPTIEKLVPTTNKYWGYDQMKGHVVSGNVDTKPSEDRSFVRFERNKTTSDQYYHFLQDNTAVTGQYLVFKYRTSTEARIQVWANTLANGHDGGKANNYVNVIADNEWHIAVVDLSTLISTHVQAVDGKYTVQWARIDMLDVSRAAGTYFDFGFIVLTDDITKIGSILIDGDEAICPHKAADNAVWTLDENDPMFEKTDCVICGDNCGGKAERYVSNTPDDLIMFTPDEIQNKLGGWSIGTVTVLEDKNGIPYVQFKATNAFTSEQNGHLYVDVNNPVTNIGKYVAILWRSTNSTPIEVVVDSKSSYVLSNVLSLGGPNASNEWTFSVKAYNAFNNTTAGGYFDGESFTAFRLDWYNGTVAEGDTRDIAFIAYFDTEAEAYAYYAQYVKAYDINCEHFTTTTVYDSNTQRLITTCDTCGVVIENKACDHSKVTTAWNSAAKLYTFTCDYCGNVETSEVLYKTEAYKENPSGGVYSQEDGFIRYTWNNETNDPYVHVFRGNTTNVTGRYMIIRYRAVNGTSVTTSTSGNWYAGTLAGGNGGASGNGDGSGITRYGYYITDGEWHNMIVSVNPDTNAKFAANADGTYTWRYLRLMFAPVAYDGSCYLDVDEVAFVDNIEAAEYYAHKDSPVAINNLDGAYCTLNGTSITADVMGVYTPIVLDLEGQTLNSAADGFALGGWVCTPGGVASYKYRITSVDGVAVENPELINWGAGTYRNDIYTAAGKAQGFSDACANGAGMVQRVINLSAYAGKKVNIEIVAISNYGTEVVAVKVNNLTVAAAE